MPAMLGAMAFMPGVKDLIWLSEDAQKRDCIGCCREERHVEDVEYTRTISHFHPDLNVLRENHKQRLEQQARARELAATAAIAQKSIPVESKQVDELVVDGDYLMHTVRPTDTLAGLEVRYGVSAAQIRRSNPQMVGDVFQHIKLLRIPRVAGLPAPRTPLPMDENAQHRVMVQAFASQHGCQREEAKFYLEDCNWDVQKAHAAFVGDLEFEKTKKL
jgi:hypothetical protein